MKILVADDSKISLMLLTAALEKLGHEVSAVSSGKEAIYSFLKSRPDIIILDVVMEGMNGFECARKLRKIHSEDWIPIIFLSATVDDESVSQGIDAGGDDYLTKPFSEIILAAKIKAMQRIADMQKKLYELTEKLQILSSTDVLTGLYNRHQFEKGLKEKIAYAERYESNLALLFMDLDYFKNTNDSFGHHVGDLLLKDVGTRLRGCLREVDFIARIGGDEFAIILSEIPQTKVGAVAQKILSSIAAEYCVEGHPLHIGASIGIAIYSPLTPNADVLVQQADIAMYGAKKAGRNSFQYFTNTP